MRREPTGIPRAVMTADSFPTSRSAPLLVRRRCGPLDAKPLDGAPDDRRAEKYVRIFAQGEEADHIYVGRLKPCRTCNRNLGQIKGSSAKTAGAVLTRHLARHPWSTRLGARDLRPVMSVNPGFWRPRALNPISGLRKVRRLRRMCDERGLDSLDRSGGGLKLANAWQVIEWAQCDRFGLGVFNSPTTAKRSAASATAAAKPCLSELRP